jgi:hypothetical protein
MIIFDRVMSVLDSFGDQLSSETVMKPSGTVNGMFLRQKNHCITEREKIIIEISRSVLALPDALFSSLEDI